MEKQNQDFYRRKFEAAKALVRMTFEHLPIGSTPRMNVVNVAERCHEIVEGSFPYQPRLPFEHPVSNRTDAELGWDSSYDSEGCYIDRETIDGTQS